MAQDTISAHNEAVKSETLNPDPRFLSDHPLHEVSCGWCGEIHHDKLP